MPAHTAYGNLRRFCLQLTLVFTICVVYDIRFPGWAMNASNASNATKVTIATNAPHATRRDFILILARCSACWYVIGRKWRLSLTGLVELAALRLSFYTTESIFYRDKAHRPGGPSLWAPTETWPSRIRGCSSTNASTLNRTGRWIRPTPKRMTARPAACMDVTWSTYLSRTFI